MKTIQILSPGPFTTVQDIGRFGYLKSGIGPSGVMDREAFFAANELVGNPPGAAVLEATLAGPTIRFLCSTVCAVTGGEMKATLDGLLVPSYQSLQVKKGQTLSLGPVQSGCRTYLAFQGGIQVPPVMGSRSTNLKCKLGGFQGRALKAGDILPIGDIPLKNMFLHGLPFLETLHRKKKVLKEKYHQPQYPSHQLIRVLEGPQADLFTDKGIRLFYGTSYLVSPESDRMGIRLEGIPVESKAGTDIVSDGIVFGSIQVPADGKPIVLMADHQTTGGYAKIATVCSFDLPKLAQARPGDRIQFVRITYEQALQIRKEVPYDKSGF